MQVSLLATRIEGAAEAPTAMLIGYTITAAGFILFFGPWAVATNIAAAADQTKRKLVRLGRGLSAGLLLIGLGYIMFAIIMLMAGTDIVCKGITFGSPECNHGLCAAGGQRCDCYYGYGPEESDHGDKGLPAGACGTPLEVCTRGQISRGSTSSTALAQQCSSVCCSGHGSCAADGTCACEFGWYGHQCESQWCTESVDSPTCAASCCAGVGTCQSSSGGGRCECQQSQGVGAVTPTSRFSCDSQAELNTAFDFSITICKQVGETYADAVFKAPSTCHSLLCAEALESVKLRCSLFLSSSPVLASRRRELEQAVERCHKVPRRPGCDEHPLTSSDATPSRIEFGATPCSGFVTTLTGSSDTFSAMTVTIDAGPGRLVQLNVTVLASQSDDRGFPGETMSVYDGDYSDARGPLLAEYHGPGGEPSQWSSLPNTTVAVSSGRMMSLRTYPDPLSAFVGAISCVLPCVGSVGETNSPCGVHGTACYLDDANRAICTCESGYGGAACEQQCVNGTCLAVVGTRDAHLSGTYIRSSKFSCHGQPVYVQDDGSSGGHVLYQPPSGYREWDITTLAKFTFLSTTLCEKDPGMLFATGCDGTPDSCRAKGWYEPSATEQYAPCPTALVVPTWGSGCAAAPDCGHGVCIAAGASHSCTCDYGYSGASCAHDPCTDAQCPGRHSSCARNANGLGHTCPCDPGWHGIDCDLNCTNGACPEFTIAGTRDPQLHGVYTKTDHVCNGRPVYQQGGSGSYVLYTDTSIADYWNVGTSEHATSCELDFGHLRGSQCDGTPDRCQLWNGQSLSNTAVRIVATSGSGCTAATECGYGVCISSGANYTCGCDYGYSGPSCAHDPCVGQCVSGHVTSCERSSDGLGHTCSCDPSWYGANCETPMASAFAVSGTRDARLSGIYTKTAHDCNGKPVYQQSGSGGHVLYRDNAKDWDVGDRTECDDPGFHLDDILCTSNPKFAEPHDACAESPDGDGCVGRWGSDGSFNPQLKVVAVHA
jgi:hypothetical protein